MQTITNYQEIQFPSFISNKFINFVLQIIVRKIQGTKYNMFEGAIYLMFTTFGVCPFYTGLTHRIRLNLGEKKKRGGVYSIIVIILYYIPPSSFLAQIESDPCGLTVLSLWPGKVDFYFKIKQK